MSLSPADGIGVRCSGVHAGYDETPVLCGLDLDIRRGEVVSVRGISGSGKSTLLLVLAGLLPPTAGEVIVEGTSIYQLDADGRTRFRRENVGLVFQFGQLVAELTAGDNVALPLLLGGAHRHRAAEQARAMLGEVGLSKMTSRYPHQLSGGQRQRVAVARALVTDPLLVLADEPTGSLDSRTSQDVLDLLCRSTQQAGASLVLVTHDEGVARRADRQLHLHDGALATESLRP